MTSRETYFEEDPLWFKDAIIYEVHVKSFKDGNEDGMGDFKGLMKKLPYLEDLGITAVWLLPFYPSPLKDDGYDIADYFNVNPDYGTVKDFRELVKEAHRRGIRIITELVLNHTSDRHSWFQKARRAKKGSPLRDFYVWNHTPEKYREARIIFKDFENSNWSWDPVAKAYYWHRFYSHQPDLNFENPRVQKELLRVVDFWLEMGVDGMRLDAVPYLYEREGTNCENLEETFAFLKKLRAHVDGKFKNKLLLAEANQWPEDAVAYFGEGNMCHMAYHFPLMPRMFMAVQMEDRFPVMDILDQTPPLPSCCQWALFLRNHDELTLEMVTDEERDYMYRFFARDPRAKINLGIRRRLAPLLNNNRRKLELMNILLFSLPGTPVIYYGDEIGMGDNYYLGDRNGVRTPMQWSPDKNAGFSGVNPQGLYLPIIIDPEYHYEALNVETQETNLSSTLWWMKRAIAMRKRYKAFGRGGISFIQSDNTKILAFIRRHRDECILVVLNLSRFSQVVRLDLSGFAGTVPEDVFSQNPFPVIKEAPYVLTLGPHGYYLFLLRMERESIVIRGSGGLPELKVRGRWNAVLEGPSKRKLERDILPGYVENCLWFRGKSRKLRQVRVLESIPLEGRSAIFHLLMIEVAYREGQPDVYLLPLSFAPGDRSTFVRENYPQSVIARLKVNNEEGVLYDGVYDELLRKSLLEFIARRKRIKTKRGELVAEVGKQFGSMLEEDGFPSTSAVFRDRQSNSSILFGSTFYLKLYRRLEEGLNPDAEMARIMTERLDFPHVPPFAGTIEYRRRKFQPVVIGLLQDYIVNEGDGWRYALHAAEHYFERILMTRGKLPALPESFSSLFDIRTGEIPGPMQDSIGGLFLEMIDRLGERTAGMHGALSTLENDPDFAPEPFSRLYQRSLQQSMRNLTRRVFRTLAGDIEVYPADVRRAAAEILMGEKEILERMKSILGRKIPAKKMRIHGDYGLEQVLYSGKDFFVIDFEGRSTHSIGERRLKRSPLRDVAGMLSSFHYAAYHSLFVRSSMRPEDILMLEPWADLWYRCVGGVFLESYTAHGGALAGILPRARDEVHLLLELFLLEKAVSQLGYELAHRPDWVIIPIKGIQYLLRNRM